MTPDKPFEVTVLQRACSAVDLVSLQLDASDPALNDSFQVPGQFVVLTPGDQRLFVALASAPGAPVFELLLKTGGGGAADQVASMSPGERLAVSAAQGRGFPLHASRGRHLLLLAAGSGIAPLRAVIQSIRLTRGDFGPVSLVWGLKSMAHCPYEGELAEWREAGIDTTLVYSATPASPGLRHVQDILDTIPLVAEQTDVMLCGMKPMVEAAKAKLHARGIPPSAMHTNF
ncbi:MAG: hypothetical protein VKP62_12690 [Candidatus Sericytochromatia bacterium]|nr:hypothetical protein [Candidatus Sericytochromatia bacterium]